MAVLLAGCIQDQRNGLKLLNHDRRAAGVRSLIADSRLQRAAQDHSARMARSRTIYHSTLRLTDNMCAMAENVGVGSSITQVEQAFLKSGSHRATIMNSRYDHGWVGVTRAGGRAYVVELFVDRC